ncbi:hypothetical protein AB4Z19_12295 [Pseudoduganella sp. RAF19]|jgi:hypothetical protein|uniref:hypothetical protein n=1 Tax=Pseudoduganella sp. RAF19 TaxID=3233052 RepID=UPI003F96B7D3
MDNKHSLQVLAVTSGLGDQRIAELWEGADLYAQIHAGSQTSPYYRQLLEERLTELVQREVARRDGDKSTSWVMRDAHLGLIHVSCAELLRAFGGRARRILH